MSKDAQLVQAVATDATKATDKKNENKTTDNPMQRFKSYVRAASAFAGENGLKQEIEKEEAKTAENEGEAATTSEYKFLDVALKEKYGIDLEGSTAFRIITDAAGNKTYEAVVSSLTYKNEDEGINVTVNNFKLVIKNNKINPMEVEKLNVKYDKDDKKMTFEVENAVLDIPSFSFTSDKTTVSDIEIKNSTFLNLDQKSLSVSAEKFGLSAANGIAFTKLTVEATKKDSNIADKREVDYDKLTVVIDKAETFKFQIAVEKMAYAKDDKYKVDIENGSMTYDDKDGTLVTDLKNLSVSTPLFDFAAETGKLGLNPFVFESTNLDITLNSKMENKTEDGDVDAQKMFTEVALNPFDYLGSLGFGLRVNSFKYGDTGFTIDKVSLTMKKIKLKLGSYFNMTIDITQGTAELGAQYKYPETDPTGDLFDASASVPIVPGLQAKFGVKASAGVNFSGSAKAAKKKRNWAVNQINAKVNGNASAEVYGGLEAGVPAIINIAASIYAKAIAAINAGASLTGDVGFLEGQDGKRHLKFADNYRIDLNGDFNFNAAVGAKVDAQALVIFKKELFNYEFANWDILTAKLGKKIYKDPKTGEFVSRFSRADFATHWSKTPPITKIESYYTATDIREKLLDAGLPVYTDGDGNIAIEIKEEAKEYIQKYDENLTQLEKDLKAYTKELEEYPIKKEKEIAAANTTISKHSQRLEKYDAMKEFFSSDELKDYFVGVGTNDINLIADKLEAVEKLMMRYDAESLEETMGMVFGKEKSGFLRKEFFRTPAYKEAKSMTVGFEKTNPFFYKMLKYSFFTEGLVTKDEDGNSFVKIGDEKIDVKDLQFAKTLFTTERNGKINKRMLAQYKKVDDYNKLKLKMLNSGISETIGEKNLDTFDRESLALSMFLLTDEYSLDKAYLKDVFSNNAYKSAKKSMYTDYANEANEGKSESDKISVRDTRKQFKTSSKSDDDYTEWYSKKRTGLNKYIVEHERSRVSYYEQKIVAIKAEEAILKQKIQFVTNEKEFHNQLKTKVAAIDPTTKTAGRIDLFADDDVTKTLKTALLRDERYVDKFKAIGAVANSGDVKKAIEDSKLAKVAIMKHYSEIFKKSIK